MFAFTRSQMVVGFMLAALLLVPVLAGMGGPEPKDSEIKKLLDERLAMSVKIYDMSQATFQAGHCSYAEVATAQAALLNARLEMCETKADRLAVRKEMVEAAKQMTGVVKAQVESGRVATIELLKAQAQLLDAQIGLEREKAEK